MDRTALTAPIRPEVGCKVLRPASVGSALDWTERSDDGLILTVDTSVYREEAVFRACYTFTDRCYLFVERAGAGRLKIRFRKRDPLVSLDRVAGEFGNELINQRIRVTLAEETRSIRELIVSKAFADAQFEQP
jgi:His-Xaa-Ser system protein HxsD